MTPQMKLAERDSKTQVAEVEAEQAEQAKSKAPTYGERQGLAMGWVTIALGTFLLFAGLALWAAAVLNAGFGGWLLGVAVLGVIMVAAIIAVGYFVIRPGRAAF
ncbi:MAG TPA: hypothetical protein VF040_16115 [Ktedonobacterales bacterium]